MNILPKSLVLLITGIAFDNGMLHVFFADGREIRVPLECFPKLRDARPEERRHWRFIGQGIGVYWPELDEDISLDGLLN
jgi:hypothetical protein